MITMQKTAIDKVRSQIQEVLIELDQLGWTLEAALLNEVLEAVERRDLANQTDDSKRV
jgi:hypothetical protein